MNKSRFRTIYNHDRPVSPHGGESMTDQQYLKECDINHILKSFKITGRLPADLREGVSGDFSTIGDFQSCLDRINRAKDEFSALPSDLRARFGNDPAAYVAFVLDPANTDECIRLGLKEVIEKKPTSEELLQEIAKNTKKEDVTPPKGGASAA